MTVLFADLVGSVPFGERVDAESVRDTLAEYHAMARRVIEEQGGVLAKFIGDGVMALYGVPETSEDDAGRAVATGLALQSEFSSLAGQVEQRYGVELALRVGVNTGEVVIGAGDDDLVGDAVNTAARLESACRPGEVLVGESTWRLTRTSVTYDPLGEIDVKGKAEPVATYQVVSTVALNEEAPTPFVGRNTELSRIRSVFDEAVSGRDARLVTVIGSPGVGKTRLMQEFSSSFSEAVAVLEIRCRRSGRSTFAPITDLLRTTAGIAVGDSTEAVRSAIRELVDDLEDADRVAELLTRFFDAGLLLSTEEAFFAVRRLTEAIARRRPVVVVVDDIQWAEPLFLDLIEHLTEWVQGASVLIVTLARPEIRDIRASFATEGRGLRAVVQLEGLDAEETAELANRLVGSGSLPAELLGRLPASTEGNPLFVRELVKMLVDDGVIAQSDGSWTLTIEAEAITVPPTIQSLLSARIDRLSTGERRLLELASVVGSEFPLGAVEAVFSPDATSTFDVREAMDRLRRRELVEPAGRYWGDEAVFRFHHVLIRDEAYRRILKRTRADLHVRIGEWTERTSRGLAGEHEALIGYHFEQAYRYLRDLSASEAETRPIGETAAELLAVAAQRSLERDDVASAGGLAERAIACLDLDDPTLPDLLVIGAEALLAFGDVPRGTQLVRRLRELGGSTRMRAWAQCFEAQLVVLTEPEGLEEAVSLLDTTASDLRDFGDQSGVAKARLVRAQALARLGHIGECEPELDVALTAARAANDRRRVAAVLGEAPVAALWGPSPIPRAGGRCLDVIRLLRITGGSPAVEAVSTRCQGVLEALRGRFDTARSMLAEAHAMVEELGLRNGVYETEFFTGIVELLAENAAAADAHLRRAYEGFDQLGLGTDASHAASYLARALLQLGRLDEADEVAREAERRARQNPLTGISARAVRAEIALRRGHLDEAATLAHAAVVMAMTTDLVVDHIYANSVLAKVARAIGDEPTAQRAQSDTDALEARKGITPVPEASETTSTTVPERNGPTYPPGRDCIVEDRTTTQSNVHTSLPATPRRRVLATWLGPISLVELRADGGFHRFAVEEYDPTGELARVVLFDPTTRALRAACHAADTRFAEIAPVAPSFQVIVQYTGAIQHLDAEAFVDLTEPEFVLVEHRPLGWPSPVPRDQLADLYRQLIATPNDPYFVGDLLAVGAHGLVLRGGQITVSADGELDEAQPMCLVIAANDRRVERVEMFSQADASNAIARFHELAGTSPLDRTGPVVVDHENTDNDSDADLIESARRSELAAWDPRFSLVELNDADRGFRRFAVEEHSPGGELIDLELHPATMTGLHAAAEQYSRKFAESSEHPAIWQLLYEFGAAIARSDADAVERLVTPDYIQLDHRELPFPPMDRDGLLEAMGSVAGAPDSVFIGGQPLVVTDRGVVRRLAAFTVRPDGSVDEQMPACAVIVTNGRQLERSELFPEAHADRAVAHFRELTGGPGPSSNGLANLSTQIADRYAEVFNARGDLRSHGFAADYSRIDRRRAVGTPAADAEETVQASEAYFGDDSVIELEHLAIRGRYHSLHRAVVTIRGSTTERLNVGAVDFDGRLRLTIQFDGDAFDDAIDELDRQWSLSLTDADQDVIRVATRYVRAAANWDIASFEELLTDDFASYDGTPLGAGSLDRHEFLESQRLHGELHGPQLTQVFDIMELAGHGVLLTRVRASGRGRRSQGDWERRHSLVLQVRSDQVRRFGLFDHDDFDAARAWTQGLDPPEPVAEPLDNLARQVARRMLEAMNDGTLPDRNDEFFEPDWQRIDHRSIIGTGVIDASTHAIVNAGVVHSDEVNVRRTQNWIAPLAIRGQFFSLSRGLTSFQHEFESTYLVMSEVSPAGRQVRADMFDDEALAGAIAELDRRWTATLTAQERDELQVLDHFGRALDDDDNAALEKLLGPSFWFDDRQPLGAGVLDRAAFLDVRIRNAEAHGGSWRHRHAIDFPSPHVAVLNTSVSGLVSVGEWEWQKTLWIVAELSGGQIHHAAGFNGNQREAALRYAKMIASDNHRDGVLRNRAVEIADRIARRIEAGIELSATMLADGFVFSEHTIDGKRRESDAEAYMAHIGRRPGPRARLSVQPVAVRDDHAMLANVIDDTTSGPTLLMLLLVDDDDRLVRMCAFDSNASDAATIELHRAWWSTLSTHERTTVRVAGDFGRAFLEQDDEAFDEVLSPDFVAVEHGDFGLGEMDREQYLASHWGRNDLFGPSRQVYDVVMLPSPDVMIIRSAAITSPGSDGWEDVVWNVMHVEAGRLMRLEVHSEMEPDDPGPAQWARQRAQDIIDSTTSP